MMGLAGQSLQLLPPGQFEGLANNLRKPIGEAVVDRKWLTVDILLSATAQITRAGPLSNRVRRAAC